MTMPLYSQSSPASDPNPATVSASLNESFGQILGKTLRVIMADDHVLVLEVIASMLSVRGNMQVETATNLTDALTLADAHDRLDVIVLDYDMPGMNGLEGLQRMVALHKGPVAVLTGHILPGMAEAVRLAGGVGLLSKSSSAAELALILRAMAFGTTHFHTTPFTATGADNSGLSKVETRVILMISKGMQNKSIGVELGLPETTIKMHIRSIFKKLGAHNRTDAVRLWKLNTMPMP
jgi:DNA-binding NarL/FixJ family response regulator